MKSRSRRSVSVLAAFALVLAGCGAFDEARELLRSDPPLTGMQANLQYVNNGSPNGLSSQNEISYHGINGNSPMRLTHTTFDSTSASRLQSAKVLAADGADIQALGMDKWSLKVGLSEYLDTQVGTYERRDYLGNRVCGAKVRMTFQPNLFQVIANDANHRQWDSIAYYSVPCNTQVAQQVAGPPNPAATLDIANATFLSLVITQQTTPRVTGKPIFFNRGNSVTVVGGEFASFKGAWWQTPTGLKNASNMIVDMVRDLDSNGWLDFANRKFGGLVYSAGDADVYASWNRILLDRQSDYLVHFRAKTSDPWKRVLIHPRYNTEWNDWSQNWAALKGGAAPDIDSLIDQEKGIPKELNNAQLKEIETSGCQNCPNPTLEQIQLINPDTGQPIFALTFRGYLGAESSLFMAGNIPSFNGKPLSRDDALGLAKEHQKVLGYDEKCPINRDENGSPREAKFQHTPQSCADWLAEGSLWDMLSGDPTKFGFDLVGQFRVRDNSSYASQCSGSGEWTSCSTVVTNRQLDANYLLSDTGDKAYKTWAVLQLLGEVGVRMLGLSYASGQYDGSGILFALAQMGVYGGYYSNLTDPNNKFASPEAVFALDARALQTPGIMAQAASYLGL
jgi:hypothetical protein